MTNGPDQNGTTPNLAQNAGSSAIDLSTAEIVNSSATNHFEGVKLPTMDATQAKIAQIQTAADFGNWLTSFMDRVRENPDIFSQTMESMNWLRDISRFAASNHQGYFASLQVQAPDSAQSWQLLAHTLYATFPTGD